jgi:hypothetical protein
MTDNVGAKNTPKCLQVVRKRPIENIQQHRNKHRLWADTSCQILSGSLENKTLQRHF